MPQSSQHPLEPYNGGPLDIDVCLTQIEDLAACCETLPDFDAVKSTELYAVLEVAKKAASDLRAYFQLHPEAAKAGERPRVRRLVIQQWSPFGSFGIGLLADVAKLSERVAALEAKTLKPADDVPYEYRALLTAAVNLRHEWQRLARNRNDLSDHGKALWDALDALGPEPPQDDPGHHEERDAALEELVAAARAHCNLLGVSMPNVPYIDHVRSYNRLCEALEAWDAVEGKG